MQVRINIGTNTKRTAAIIDDSLTPRQAFEQNKVPYDKANLYLDGVPITAADAATPLNKLGVHDDSNLLAIIKMDNAR